MSSGSNVLIAMENTILFKMLCGGERTYYSATIAKSGQILAFFEHPLMFLWLMQVVQNSTSSSIANSTE